ncbi:hypothetical protein RSOLAG22IIIB_12889 [Rhizoctonia solani]|uniref:Uncharacterized protein n=1 Tax=Rhizoctonia solani TaxID=456999 RepID=A0A0K6GH98_9AGAM|nr:hypothetical protein RSOLAG22IIIB_12889 [Rhizoctonia solani]
MPVHRVENILERFEFGTQPSWRAKIPSCFIVFHTHRTPRLDRTCASANFLPVSNLLCKHWKSTSNTSIGTAHFDSLETGFLQWVKHQSHGCVINLPFFFPSFSRVLDIGKLGISIQGTLSCPRLIR